MERPSKRRVAKNIAIVTGTEVVAKLATLVTFVLIARALGVQGFGVFSLGLSVGVFLASLSSFGMDDRLTQLGGNEPARLPVLLGSLLRLRLLFSSVATLGTVIVLTATQRPAFVASVTLLVLAAMLDTFADAFRHAANLRGRQRGPALALVAQRVGTLILVGAVILTRPGTVEVSAAYLAGSVVGLVGVCAATRRAGVRVDWKGVNRTDHLDFLRAMHITGVNGLVAMALFRIDTIVLGVLAGVIAVGHYNAAYRLVESMLFISWAIDRVLSPLLTDLRLTKSEASSLVRDGMALAALVYLPYAAVLAVRGNDLVTFLFGDDLSSTYLTACLALAPWLFAVGQLNSAALFARRPDPVVLLASSIALAVNIALNLVLIPRWQAIGAAIATTLCYGIQAAVTGAGLKRRYGSYCVGRSVIVAALCALAMGICLAAPIPLFPALAVGALASIAVWDVTSRTLDPLGRARILGLLKRPV